MCFWFVLFDIEEGGNRPQQQLVALAMFSKQIWLNSMLIHHALSYHIHCMKMNSSQDPSQSNCIQTSQEMETISHRCVECRRGKKAAKKVSFLKAIYN